jgi:hypothetical protein
MSNGTQSLDITVNLVLAQTVGQLDLRHGGGGGMTELLFLQWI